MVCEGIHFGNFIQACLGVSDTKACHVWLVAKPMPQAYHSGMIFTSIVFSPSIYGNIVGLLDLLPSGYD